MLSASAMIGDQQVKASVVSRKICRKPCVKVNRQQPASRPKASQTTASRLAPLASTRFETIGVMTIFSANDSADSAAMPTASMPRDFSHTGQNGMWMPMKENIAK